MGCIINVDDPNDKDKIVESIEEKIKRCGCKPVSTVISPC